MLLSIAFPVCEKQAGEMFVGVFVEETRFVIVGIIALPAGLDPRVPHFVPFGRTVEVGVDFLE